MLRRGPEDADDGAIGGAVREAGGPAQGSQPLFPGPPKAPMSERGPLR